MPPEVSAPPLPVTADVPRELDRECLDRIRRILAGQEPPPVMTPPPEIQKLVETETVRLSPFMTPEARQRTQDDLCLQYYYGGNEVLIWESPQGLVVLSVGMEQIGRILDQLSDEQRLKTWMRFPMSW